jgi:putative nucleotidyltransferase with HDIG domain
VGLPAHVNRTLTHLSTKIEPLAETILVRYAYPDWLRAHSLLVGRIATILAASHTGVVDPETIALGGYLHDIGRTPLMAGDDRDHGDLGALILRAEGWPRCAELARRHPVYAVLDPRTAPRALEEKIVNLADRRGAMRVMPIDERTTETAERHPRYAEQIERARPIVRAMEAEVFAGIAFAPDDLAAVVAERWPS